jgi:hypothetical protein
VPQTGSLKRASLTYTKGNQTIEFDYNPESISLGKQGKLALSANMVVQEAQLVEQGHVKVSFGNLYFHGKQVEKTVNTLFDWMDPETTDAKTTDGKSTVTPKKLRFQTGGSTDAFQREAVLVGVDAEYTRFTKDGVPIRAKIKLTLDTLHVKPDKTNPTSGTDRVGSAHTVIAGDNLQRLANAAYGRPTAWREIAEANGIDDPLRLQIGRALFVPSAR